MRSANNKSMSAGNKGKKLISQTIEPVAPKLGSKYGGSAAKAGKYAP